MLHNDVPCVHFKLLPLFSKCPSSSWQEMQRIYISSLLPPSDHFTCNCHFFVFLFLGSAHPIIKVSTGRVPPEIYGRDRWHRCEFGIQPYFHPVFCLYAQIMCSSFLLQERQLCSPRQLKMLPSEDPLKTANHQFNLCTKVECTVPRVAVSVSLSFNHLIFHC